MREIDYQQNSERVSFTGFGEIYSYTIVNEPPSGFEDSAPYILALLRLDEGVMITAQIADTELDSVYIGMKVRSVTRILRKNGEKGIIEYGYKFIPTN